VHKFSVNFIRANHLIDSGIPSEQAIFGNKRVNGHVILQLGSLVRIPHGGFGNSMQDRIIDSAAIISKDMGVFACV
jgi:hypothetical protein